MNYSEDRLHYLVKAFQEGRGTELEFNELEALLKERWSEIPLHQSVSGIDWATMYQEIVSMDDQKRTPVVPIKRSVAPMWKVVGAVAAVLLISALFIWMNQDRRVAAPVPSGVAAKADLPPGKEGAILTLADGSRILLDSLGNGMVTTQGGTSVLIKNGQLVYDLSPAKNEVVYNTMTTPRGRQFSLVLADGTRVWLNAASSITYPTAFTGRDREIQITGEVFFEVAKDPSRPFHVKTGNMDVEVLGTHFNVNAYADEESINTTLLEGSVKVSRNGQVALLKPGQQAVARASSLAVDEVPNLDRVTAWKNNRFYFQDDNIKTIMRQLERWYSVKAEFDGTIGNEYTGIISKDVPISKVLELFEKVGDISFSIEGNTIRVHALK